MGDILTEILRAASKHPNSRVSKLIHTVEEDPSQKNIVLLLIELAEHAEYSTDFNISLKYYLDLFERCGIDSDLVLNEAGLLLVNSSKIYSKRVDYVQSLVERQILTLSNADNELQQQKLKQQQEESSESTTPVEKPKRGRKRALEAPSDPYEVELAPKKFKKLTEEKRFAVQKSVTKAKSLQRNIEMEQHIHPAGWMHATIHDLENEEDVDTKRNYKLFTYHIEHRYNTLVPDINFRLHFKVKDYMDAQEEEMDESESCNTDRSWPPLSEEYVQKYIKLENYVLEQDIQSNKRNATTMEEEDDDDDDREYNDAPLNNIENQLNNIVNNMNIIEQNLNTSEINESKNDSGLGQSMLDESNKNDTTLDATQLDLTAVNNTLEVSDISDNLNETNLQETDKSLNTTQTQQENDSALGTSILDQSNNNELNSSADISGNLDNTNLDNATLIEIVKETSGDKINSVNENLDTTNDKSTETSGNQDTIAIEGAANNESEEISTSGNSTENPNATSTEIKTTENSENMETSIVLEGNLEAQAITADQSKETFDSTVTTDETNITLSLDLAETQITVDTSKQTSDSTGTTDEINNTLSLDLPVLEGNLEAQVITADQSKETFDSTATTTTDETNITLSLDLAENAQIVSNELLLKATENRKDSALSDDRHLSISTENLAIKSTNGSTLSLNIDIIDGNRENLSKTPFPHTDDEGVYLSDLEDHDTRMLSPTVALTNILPGVQRKDVTIYMDDELRKALELRDDIFSHFGRETYNVPVVTEPTKQPLLFNILKLPEKIIRKKVLFKLGPDMDLFLQARSLKRARPDPQPREYRTAKLLQWYSLNNTDMSGVCMTPPHSPGHSSDFCGFTDDELDTDDTISCIEFCGFTPEEQHTLQLKNVQRLSRDSGVGVEGNQLTPEKERYEIIFEDCNEPATVKLNLNFDENKKKTSGETVESIIDELPSDIRDVLRAELMNNTETTNETSSQELSSENSSESLTNFTSNTEGTEELSTDIEQLSTDIEQLSSDIDQLFTEPLSTDNEQLSTDIEQLSTEQISTDIVTWYTDMVDKLSAESATEDTTETLLCSEEKQSGYVPSQTINNTEELIVSAELSTDVEMAYDQSSSAEEINKTNETDSDNINADENNIEGTEHISTDIMIWYTDMLDKLSTEIDTDNTEPVSETLLCSEEKLSGDVPSQTIENTIKLEASDGAEHQNNVSDLTNKDVEMTCESNNTFDAHHADNDEDSDDETFLNIDLQGTKTKIQQWHEHLQPILAKSRERHHFDVFKLGTEIIETVQKKQQSEEESMSFSTTHRPIASFHDIMDNKDKSYVSRYFLSSLLLANQSNVEILVNNKSSESPSCWNDIQLKLLSTKRHTVAIEDNIGMISDKKKGTQKQESDPKARGKSQKKIDESEEDEPLIKLQETPTKISKKSKTVHKRTSDNSISTIAEKRLKESSFLAATSNVILKPNESSTTPNIISNVQIFPPLIPPEFDKFMDDKPSTSRKAQDLQVFHVNLNSVRTLQPITKVLRTSDDYDSGIFSIDELST